MKNRNSRIKASHDLSYLLRHDRTYTFETGGWRPVENLVREQGAIWWPTTPKAGLSSMKARQRFGHYMDILCR